MSETDLNLVGFARAQVEKERAALAKAVENTARLEAFAETLPFLPWANPKSVSASAGYLRDASLRFTETSRQVVLDLLDAFPPVAVNRYTNGAIVSVVPAGREAEAKVDETTAKPIAPLKFRFTFGREEFRWWTQQGGLLTEVEVLIESGLRASARPLHNVSEADRGTFIWAYSGLPEGTRTDFGALRGDMAGDVAVHWTVDQPFRELLLTKSDHLRRCH